jgi:tripartite-type tricarboxylate transporter receptor subunit TctC
VPGYDVDVWYGLIAPRGTPRPVVTRISAEASRIMRAPDMQERWVGIGVDPVGSTPAEFKAVFVAEIAKWTKVVKAAGLSAD